MPAAVQPLEQVADQRVVIFLTKLIIAAAVYSSSLPRMAGSNVFLLTAANCDGYMPPNFSNGSSDLWGTGSSLDATSRRDIYADVSDGEVPLIAIDNGRLAWKVRCDATFEIWRKI